MAEEQINITGTWALRAWRRYLDNGTVVYPFGENASGLLIYTSDGYMAVQMLTADRPPLQTDDPIGGSLEERAAAYSSCLAYFGRYEVDGPNVTHKVESSLFPNWSDTIQERPFVCSGGELSLQVRTEDGHLTNEIVWIRSTAYHLDAFLELSVALTGFSRFQLLGTSMAKSYLEVLESTVSRMILSRLFEVFHGLPRDEGRKHALARQILDDTQLGPVARNIIMLWYCGTWTQLPAHWRAANGASPLDETRVVSARSYVAGLQWTLVGAHPAGAREQGFAAWAIPPKVTNDG